MEKSLVSHHKAGVYVHVFARAYSSVYVRACVLGGWITILLLFCQCLLKHREKSGFHDRKCYIIHFPPLKVCRAPPFCQIHIDLI